MENIDQSRLQGEEDDIHRPSQKEKGNKKKREE